MVQQAKDEGLTIKVRHAKIMFCGASHAGKSSFSRLLQNKPHKYEYKSTAVGETTQVMSNLEGSNCPGPDDKKYLIAEKVNLEDSSWVTLNSKKETERLANIMCLLLKKQKKTEDDNHSNDSIDSSVSTASNEQTINSVPSSEKTVKEETNIKSEDELSNKGMPENQTPLPATDNQPSKPSNVEEDRPNKSIQVLVEEEMANIPISELKEKIPETWDLFTLLDTGGQPEFIKMLPAINAFATITFVVLNMNEVKKCMDTPVTAQYSCKDSNYPEHEMKYTNKELVECLLSSVRIAATVQVNKTYFDKEFIDKIIVKSDHEHPKPVVGFIGTHADELENEYDDVVNYFNEEIRGLEIIKYKDQPFDIWRNVRKKGNVCTKGYLFAVDNTKNSKGIKTSAMETIQKNTSEAVKVIHDESNKILTNTAQYTIPITWFILELEIRKHCDINKKVCISLTEIKGICDQIMPPHKTMEIEVIKEVMKFYHMFGTLLYFHKVDGMKEIVITNPQWLFNNLTKIVTCQFDENLCISKDHDINIMEKKGICNESLLEMLTLDLRQDVEIKSFLKLLVHLKVIAPIPSKNNDQYFIPSVLPMRDSLPNITSGEQFGKAVIFTTNGEEIEVKDPLLITSKFGTIPRGLFGFLVVQLLQDNPKLYSENDLNSDTYYCFADQATFRIQCWWYFTIIDKISYLELQVRVEGNNQPSYHRKVQEIVTNALGEVCDQFNWQLSDCRYGFLCKKCTTKDHPSLLLDSEAPITSKIDDHTECMHRKIMPLNEKEKRIWFEVCNICTYISLFNYIPSLIGN